MIVPTESLDTQGVFDLVRTSLEGKLPLSIVRCGDGEAMIMTDIPDHRDFVLQRQLGYLPPNVNQIRDNLLATYTDADVIGLPTPPQLRAGGFWPEVVPLLEKLVYRTKPFVRCSVCFSHDFLNAGILGKLMQGRSELFYVSCRSLSTEFTSEYSIKKVQGYIIPPEVKFTKHTGERHFPEQFEKVRNWIKGLGNCAGELMLVGAGVVGKIYCQWFKEQGGVALDIGSVFDSWAGLATRGPDRGPGVTDDEHKLKAPEYIYSKSNPSGIPLHIIVRANLSRKGRRDLVAPTEFIQCSMLEFDKGTTFKPHKHILKQGPHQVIAQESWVVISGRVRCSFYDIDNKLLCQPELGPGDASFTLAGGHTYEIMEDGTKVYEYKTGPYTGQQNDKVFI